MLERRIEEASLNSWPALQQLLFDGWVMRFSGGYRNAQILLRLCIPLFSQITEKIVACENFYRKKQLPTIFRFVSFSSTAHDLDALLAQLQYQRIDHTRILCAEITSSTTIQSPALRNIPLAEWLALFCQFKQDPIEQHHSHHEMLKRIIPDLLCAVLYNAGLPVACGLGVLEKDVFGMFDIITKPQQRNKGHGTQLVSAMLDWARHNGAKHAYLQVVNTNQVAHHLYTKLGFHELYHYCIGFNFTVLPSCS